jgi:hypothetical protein
MPLGLQTLVGENPLTLLVTALRMFSLGLLAKEFRWKKAMAKNQALRVQGLPLQIVFD